MQQRADDAIDVARRALSLIEPGAAETLEYEGRLRHTLGGIAYERREVEAAEAELAGSLAAYASVYGAGDMRTEVVRMLRADCLVALDRLEEAEPELLAAFEAFGGLPENDPRRLFCIRGLLGCYLKGGDEEEHARWRAAYEAATKGE